MHFTLKNLRNFKALSRLTAILFCCNFILPGPAFAANYTSANLPAPGSLISMSPSYTPVLLKGMTIYKDDPLRFDFIVDSGQSDAQPFKVQAESERLIHYFLAGLTIPQHEWWVNLSPYENNRIVPEPLGETELGRDLLIQDYLLKQLTASLMYPEGKLGKKFWDRIYKSAFDRYGITDVPIDAFNKVWIIPESATIYEKDQTVFILKNRLKVLLEHDYLAMQRSSQEKGPYSKEEANELLSKDTDPVSSLVVQEVILPELEKEINEGENFSSLRQIFNSLILAKWYKETVHESPLTTAYIDQKKISGINLADGETIKKKIFDQYLTAFKIGAYDYIKEEYDYKKKESVPRKYFSGGVSVEDVALLVNKDPAPELLVSVGQPAIVQVSLIEGSLAQSQGLLVEENPEDLLAALIDRPDKYQQVILGLKGSGAGGEQLLAGVIIAILTGSTPVKGAALDDALRLGLIIRQPQQEPFVQGTFPILDEGQVYTLQISQQGLSYSGQTEQPGTGQTVTQMLAQVSFEQGQPILGVNQIIGQVGDLKDKILGIEFVVGQEILTQLYPGLREINLTSLPLISDAPVRVNFSEGQPFLLIFSPAKNLQPATLGQVPSPMKVLSPEETAKATISAIDADKRRQVLAELYFRKAIEAIEKNANLTVEDFNALMEDLRALGVAAERILESYIFALARLQERTREELLQQFLTSGLVTLEDQGFEDETFTYPAIGDGEDIPQLTISERGISIKGRLKAKSLLEGKRSNVERIVRVIGNAGEYKGVDLGRVIQSKARVIQAADKQNIPRVAILNEPTNPLIEKISTEEGRIFVGILPYQREEAVVQPVPAAPAAVMADQETADAVAPGGIDMDKISFDREERKENAIQFDPSIKSVIFENGVDGLIPVIINYTPVTNVLPLLGLEPPQETKPAQVSSLPIR